MLEPTVNEAWQTSKGVYKADLFLVEQTVIVYAIFPFVNVKVVKVYIKQQAQVMHKYKTNGHNIRTDRQIARLTDKQLKRLICYRFGEVLSLS